MRPILALLILLVPGCVAPDSGQAPTPDDAAATARVIPWSLEECSFLVMEVPVDADRLRALLPEGFEPQPGGGLVAALSGPTLGIEAFECARGAGLDGAPVAPLAWASFFTSVVPPDAYAQEDVDFHFVMWDTLVPDAPRREVLAAQGLPVHDGTVLYEHADSGPLVRMTFTLDGLGTFVMDGTDARPGEPFGGTFVEYMPAAEGRLAAWRTDYQATTAASGRGILLLEPGSWPAQLVGDQRAVGSFVTGRWSFTNGTTTLPPAESRLGAMLI